MIFFVVAIGLHFLLSHKNTAMLAKIDVLEMQQREQQMQDDSMRSLDARKKLLNQQWSLLASLRRGTSMLNIMQLIDKALPGNDIWFTDLRYIRSDRMLSANDNIPSDGTHIIAIDNARLAISSFVSLQGNASDHSAFSVFVERLLRQPRIFDAKVLNTSSTDSGSIKFSLMLRIDNVIVGDDDA